jgi:hypothetical protein
VFSAPQDARIRQISLLDELFATSERKPDERPAHALHEHDQHPTLDATRAAEKNCQARPAHRRTFFSRNATSIRVHITQPDGEGAGG